MLSIRRSIVIGALTAVPLCGVAAQGAGRATEQADSTFAERRIKIGASTLLGIPSFGVERPLARAGRTFQWDLTVSPWVSVEMRVRSRAIAATLPSGVAVRIGVKRSRSAMTCLLRATRPPRTP